MTRLVSQITLVNTQSQATPSNFQQFIYTTLQYPSGVRFWNPANGYFYAWLESLSSTNQAAIWVNIPSSIPAGSTYRLYMVQDSNLSFDGNYWGEAPTLSSSYAQYDNGANIFTFYDNFAGTSLNTNKWNANSYGYYSVNNGLTVKPAQETCSASPGEVTSTTTFGANTIFDFYGTPAFSGGNGWAYGTYGYNPGDAGCITLYGDIVGDANTGTANTYIWAGTSTQATFTQTQGIYTIIQTSSQVTAMFNYGSSVSTTSNIGSSSYPVGFYVGNGMSENAFIQWARIRAYPPNGVMPSVEVIA